MANIAGLLNAQLATPERILYRQFLEGGWRDVYADDNPENVAWCLENSGARLLVAENSRMADALQGVTASLPRVLCLAADPGSGHDAVEAVLPRLAPAFEAVPLADGALATICYTSGTAGRPKGVMLTHGNILANVSACERLRLAR